MNPRETRLARNETLFREVNERIESVSQNFEVDGAKEFLCECGREDCLEKVQLTRKEYEAVRAEPAYFLVLPGHERTEAERVVERHEGYLVVEKTGRAGDVAEQADPRS
ncbi:MAG: hypothetical protein ACRDNC_00815 [Gaiellaceae bacterium]